MDSLNSFFKRDFEDFSKEVNDVINEMYKNKILNFKNEKVLPGRLIKRRNITNKNSDFFKSNFGLIVSTKFAENSLTEIEIKILDDKNIITWTIGSVEELSGFLNLFEIIEQ